MRIAKEALTFDDVLLQPGYSSVLPHEVDLSTQLTREIRLNIPLISAAMDSVTESRLAIALAQEGGIGIIHKNMRPLRNKRCEVLQVKKYESGIVRDPITVSEDTSIRDVIESDARRCEFPAFPWSDEKENSGNRDWAGTCAFETQN